MAGRSPHREPFSVSTPRAAARGVVVFRSCLEGDVFDLAVLSPAALVTYLWEAAFGDDAPRLDPASTGGQKRL